MNGIDKMTQQILAEAQEQADQMLAEARKSADDALKEAGETCEVRQREAGRALELELREFSARASSARDLARRRAILEAKQAIISQIIEKTCEKLRKAETAEYFESLRRMFEKFGHGEAGQMFLSAADLARMPKDFKEAVSEIAREKGGSIEVSEEPGQISDGFLLVYGGIEENCTFEALVEADRSRLQDQVNAMLWRECNG